MSLVVIPFKDEPADLIARNLSIAANHDRVREVWGIAATEDRIGVVDLAAADISTETSTPIRLTVQRQIGALRSGKGDAMNTAIEDAADHGWDRVHFYDADITNFERSWIDGAEAAADRGFGVVRHRFPRAATDAMITWMITRPGLAMLFPGTFLPRINQPLGGELLLTETALAALASSPTLRMRSDWGIDTIITYESAILPDGLYEHHVADGKRHALYGSLDELRQMTVECLDAIISLRGRLGPRPAVPHSSDPPAPSPPDLERTVAYDIEASTRLLTQGWTDVEMELARQLPARVAENVVGARAVPTFSYMDAEAWFATLEHLFENFQIGDPTWESLAFRLWLTRVLAYTTGEAMDGYHAAIEYLESTLRDYEIRSSV